MFINVKYYQSASQQVMSCEPTICEYIPLQVVRQQGCKLRAYEPASYQVKTMLGCELT